MFYKNEIWSRKCNVNRLDVSLNMHFEYHDPLKLNQKCIVKMIYVLFYCKYSVEYFRSYHMLLTHLQIQNLNLSESRVDIVHNLLIMHPNIVQVILKNRNWKVQANRCYTLTNLGVNFTLFEHICTLQSRVFNFKEYKSHELISFIPFAKVLPEWIIFYSPNFLCVDPSIVRFLIKDFSNKISSFFDCFLICSHK